MIESAYTYRQAIFVFHNSYHCDSAEDDKGFLLFTAEETGETAMKSTAFSSQPSMKIGVTDSGIGGLTVVRELMRQLPHESIVYFGDNRNCPYGNKEPETLVSLASGMFRTLDNHTPLKLGAVACNTTSALLERFAPDFDFPLVGIVKPAAEKVAAKKLDSVGVLATVFTINSGCYQEIIRRHNPNCQVFGQGSSRLAALIDSGHLDSPEILEEIHQCMAPFAAQSSLKHILLACTHYPILEDIFRREYPQFTFINPAKEQVNTLKDYLNQQNLLSQDSAPTFEIFTTGSPELYTSMCQRLGLRPPDAIHTL